MILFILSQILGILALITAIISMQLKDKPRLLLMQILENCAKILAFAFVGGMSGAYSEMVGLARKTWFYHNAKQHKLNHIASLILFILLAVLVATLSWNGPLTLLPMVAVILGTIGLWQENIFILRYLALVASILYGIYSVYLGAYTNAVSELFMIISTIVSLIRFSPKKLAPIEKIQIAK